MREVEGLRARGLPWDIPMALAVRGHAPPWWGCRTLQTLERRELLLIDMELDSLLTQMPPRNHPQSW